MIVNAPPFLIEVSNFLRSDAAAAGDTRHRRCVDLVCRVDRDRCSARRSTALGLRNANRHQDVRAEGGQLVSTAPAMFVTLLILALRQFVVVIDLLKPL